VKAIETASAIGGPESVPIIGRALEFDTEQVFLAAQRAWWKEPGEELARVFFPLAEKRRPHYYVPVQADRISWQTRYMPENGRVSVEGRAGEDISELARLDHVVFVHLRNRTDGPWHGIDLAPLSALPRLTKVEIYGDASTESIAPLSECPLETLELAHPQNTRDLPLVREFGSLRRLDFQHALPAVPLADVVPAQGLDTLGLTDMAVADLRCLTSAPDTLRGLRLVGERGPRSLNGVESQAGALARLTVRRPPSGRPISLRPLKELGKLTALRVDLDTWTYEDNVVWISQIPDLRTLFLDHFLVRTAVVPGWVRDLPWVKDVHVVGQGRIDLAALAGATDLTVHVARSSKVVGADRLGEGSTVARDLGVSSGLW
jgi:hypothetical protein